MALVFSTQVKVIPTTEICVQANAIEVFTHRYQTSAHFEFAFGSSSSLSNQFQCFQVSPFQSALKYISQVQIRAHDLNLNRKKTELVHSYVYHHLVSRMPVALA